MKYRWIYLGLGALALAVVVVGIAMSRGGEPNPLPGPIESVFPRPNDTVIQQVGIEVDLATGYEADIYVDGFLVPSTEVRVVPGTGVYHWAPSPTSVYMSAWVPGDHRVRVVWRNSVGVAEAGEFSWVFRVQ